jgi:hypothetical protein
MIDLGEGAFASGLVDEVFAQVRAAAPLRTKQDLIAELDSTPLLALL